METSKKVFSKASRAAGLCFKAKVALTTSSSPNLPSWFQNLEEKVLTDGSIRINSANTAWKQTTAMKRLKTNMVKYIDLNEVFSFSLHHDSFPPPKISPAGARFLNLDCFRSFEFSFRSHQKKEIQDHELGIENQEKLSDVRKCKKKKKKKKKRKKKRKNKKQIRRKEKMGGLILIYTILTSYKIIREKKATIFE